MKKFAVVLSGCGVYDGAEIHEATMSLWAIARHGGSYSIFAPDTLQHHVVNHLSGEEMPETRNVLVEAARIARGQISALSELKMQEYDALILPGGFGVAKNLCSFAFKGADMQVDSEVERVILEAYHLKKPIGALCIAPVLLAKLIAGARLTIGKDEDTAGAVTSLGATHVITTHGDVTVDAGNRLYTTPCYMLDASILDVANGADNLIAAMMKGG